MNTNLRKLGTLQLIANLRKLTLDLKVQTHASLITKWNELEERRTVQGEASLSLRPEYLDLGDAMLRAAQEETIIDHRASDTWEKMCADIDAMIIEYPSVQFPLELIDATGGIFQSVNGVTFKLSELGAGYLSERMPGVKYAQLTELWRTGNFAGILATLDTQGAHLNGRNLQVAIVNGEAVGFMSSYNPVPHRQIVQLLQDQGLTGQLINYELNQTHLQVNVKVADVTKNLVAVMRIRNGHSGHYSLRFTAALMAPGYDWEAKGDLRRGRRRHLSHVQALVDQLKTAIDDVAQVLFDQNLKSITFDEAMTIIGNKLVRLNVRQEQVLLNASAAHNVGQCETALDIIETLAPYGQTKGWGASVTTLLDPLVVFAVRMQYPTVTS